MRLNLKIKTIFTQGENVYIMHRENYFLIFSCLITLSFFFHAWLLNSFEKSFFLKKNNFPNVSREEKLL